MSSVVVDIARAVTTALEDAVANDDFSAAPAELLVCRRYVPRWSVERLEKHQKIELVVAGADENRTKATRGTERHDVPVGVGFVKRVKTFEAEELDPLMDTLEQMKDALRRRLDTVPASFVSIEATSPIYSPKHLLKQHVFFALTTYTFVRFRDL